MPELPERLKEAVGDIPPFDPAALATRARRHRRRQVGAGAASATLITALVLALSLGRSGAGDEVALHTRGASSTAASVTTTTVVLTTAAPAPTSTTRRTDAWSTTATTSTPPSTLPVTSAEISPGADDFTGTLTASATTVRVGDTADIRWSIRNITDHPIEPFYLGIFASHNPEPATTSDVAAVCIPLTAGGQPAIRLTLETRRNVFMPDYNTYIQPGADLTTTGRYEATIDDIGTVTCEVVIVDLTNGFLDVHIAQRVTAIPPLTITVLPAEPPTSTSTTSTTSTTTAPSTT